MDFVFRSAEVPAALGGVCFLWASINQNLKLIGYLYSPLVQSSALPMHWQLSSTSTDIPRINTESQHGH